jgi:hypothetical protein
MNPVTGKDQLRALSRLFDAEGAVFRPHRRLAENPCPAACGEPAISALTSPSRKRRYGEQLVARRSLISGLISLVAVCTLCPLAALAAGELVQSWKTDDGWLTELRVHPNGAKVCSAGKAAYTPHTFGLTFVRSGSESVVLLVDEQQPPSDTRGGDMTFEQSDNMLGALQVQVAGPAWASVDPAGPQATALISKLSPGPLTINVAGRQYKMDLAGLAGALAQLSSCETQARR